ncbi:DUF5686 and carboxypeptidase-like regulatory domain-containing protein [Tellurirhabdus rosea]|uniref:DUF5686 and carboxypeptidase-like regulatory domain-containing protein n=1 Tax=Tellurirhabdus rosea TaxID=2674997 RepID=UPI0022548903|nr:DUF5686 and carboxypeptidase-like regulatory domain-containing protein [Tellurirhabdus rosea]
MSKQLPGFWALLCLCFFTLIQTATAQSNYTISGRITDAATGEGVPFASIALRGKAVGTTSDADGRYSLKTSQISDSLVISSLGFQTRSAPLLRIAEQVIDVKLAASAAKLKEVKVYAKGGDPAYRILREAIRRADRYDPAKLSAFQYESYTKIEAYVNNFKRPRKNGRRPGPVGRLLSKLPAVTDEEGLPAVPVFVSENYSDYYERHDPLKTKEFIRKTRIAAVGIQDGSLVSQFTGASFQQYNFYSNFLTVLRKDLPSPMGGSWNTYYQFHLMDTLRVGESVCFQIDYEPKRETDLAFNGTVWIDTTQLSLVQVEARVGKRANINFVDEIRIEQEYEATSSGHRLPSLTQIMIDMDELTPSAPGALIRFFIAATNIKVNDVHDPKFYEPALELAENYKEKDPQFWKGIRPEVVTAEEMRAFELVDSVRNIPLIKYTGEVLRLGFNGYQSLGKLHLDVGPFIYTYANNTLEGNRFRVSLRTNPGFSRRWLLSGYLAYGTRDQLFKYGLAGDYVLSKKPYTIMGARYSYDLERVGLNPENLNNNSILLAYARFGNYRRPFFQESYYGYIRRELGSGFTQTVALQNRSFHPLFPFAYRTESANDPQGGLGTDFRTTELQLETRFAPGELMVQNDNERFSVGATNKPVLTLRYALGMKGVFHGDFSYHRLSADFRHSFRVGVLGRTFYNINTGLIPSTVPYPLLHTPLGNESYFYVYNAFNMMNFFEFVCDRYASLKFEHNFEGLFFNRIPAIRRLKWRTLVTAKVLTGGVSRANQLLVPPLDASGQTVQGFRALGRTPYVEVGYGIDNILKLFRVDAIHRLTYLDGKSVTGVPIPKFAVKVSAYVSL